MQRRSEIRRNIARIVLFTTIVTAALVFPEVASQWSVETIVRSYRDDHWEAGTKTPPIRGSVGGTVSISGRVIEVFGPHSFGLSEPDSGQSEGRVLVLLEGDSIATIHKDDTVTVTGTVKPFKRADLLHDARWLHEEWILNRNLETLPVLVATRVVHFDGGFRFRP